MEKKTENITIPCALLFQSLHLEYHQSLQSVDYIGVHPGGLQYGCKTMSYCNKIEKSITIVLYNIII